MKKLSIILSLLLAMVFVPQSCSYDDSDLWNAVGDLDDRVEALEEAVRSLSDQTAVLQQLLDGKMFLESVEETDGGQILHLISASGEMSTVVILNGADGADGADGTRVAPPSIGVATDATGNYYWTIDGEPLLDADGNRVPVNGTDGTDGIDGKTPTFKVDENGRWLISFDNGITWTGPYGQATGADGDTFFTSVKVSDDGKTALITLVDGSTVTVVLYKEFNIAFDIENTMIPSGRTAEIPFRVTGAGDATVVEAIGRDGWKADVVQDIPAAGVLRVTAPADRTGTGRVVVYASDGADITIMRTLTFIAGNVSVSTTSIDIPQAGGSADITVTTNLDFTAQVEPQAASWLTLISGRAYETRTEELQISATANPGAYARTGRIFLIHDGSVVETILVVQAPVTFDRDQLVFIVDPSITGGKIILPSLELAAGSTLTVDWGDGSQPLTSTSSLTADADLSHIYADASTTYTVKISGKFTKMQIRAGSVSSYKNEGITDIVQWGTSPYTQISAKIKGLKRIGAIEPESAATVTTVSFEKCYDLESIDPDFFKGMKSLTSLNSAFRECTSLRALPDGIFDDLSSVSNLYQLFRGCTALESVPRMAKITGGTSNTINVDYIFNGCTSLRTIPGGMFSEAAKAKIKGLNNVFSECTALTSIPADFFKGIVIDPTYGNTSAMLMNCSSLEEVDYEQIFNVTGVKNYNWTNTFKGCNRLSGKIPAATLTAGGKTYQVMPWQRQDYRNHTDATVAAAAEAMFGTRNISGQNCFSGCTSLDGYSTEIPVAWGGLWDGTDSAPQLQLSGATVKGSEYYAINYLVKGKSIKDLKYLLGTKEEVDGLLPKYNNDVTRMVEDLGQLLEASSVAAANSGGLNLPFNEARPSTEYVLVVAAFNNRGQTTARQSVTTAAIPRGSSAYEAYIGRWRVTSANSVTERQADTGPVSFDITIEPYRVNESYMVTGWGTTIFRDMGHMRFMFENGAMNAYAGYAGEKSMWNTIASSYYRYTHEDYGTRMCDIGMFFYADFGSDGFSVVLATPQTPIFTSRFNGDKVEMTGGSGGDLAALGVSKVSGMDIFINTGGQGWSFTRRPAETVLDEYKITIDGTAYGKYADGPYTLERLGDLPAAKPARSGLIRLRR